MAAPVKDTTPTENIVKTGGVISNGSVTAADGYGGNIAMIGTTGKLTIAGGIIKDGNAANLNGGNIYSSAPVEITGGVIMGGDAKNGGNIYTTGTCDVMGGLIIKGNATANGGNLYPNGGATITDGLICGGTATTASGNIGVYGNEVDITDNAAVIGGFAAARGGNIGVGSEATLHISGGLVSTGYSDTRAGNIDQATETATTNVDGGVIIAGNAPNGGNIYINNGKLNMCGGSVMGGTANAGGNIYFNYYVYATLKDDGNEDTALPCVSHGKATSGNGGNIYFTAADTGTKYFLSLGSCIVRDGNASGNGNNIYIHDKGVFKVLAEFNQSTTVYIHDSRNPVKGALLTTGTNVAEGDFNGELRLENLDPNPLICSENNNLRITSTAVVMKDGTSKWFGTNADAIRNYTENAAYMIADSGELNLTGGNYVVDLAGQALSATGTGNVTFFDSANDNFSIFGTVTLDGPILKNTVQTVMNDKTYVTVAENGVYSFHRIDMGVDSISIRPANAGVYYSCTWNCDEVLSANLKSFGVAISLDHMPGADFNSDSKVLYTQASGQDFSPQQIGNSVLISNVLQRDNAQNNDRARMTIYATPYIAIDAGNGEQQAVVALAADQAHYSLYDVMKLVDDRIASDPTNFRKLTNPMRSFYETWKNDGMQTWDLKKIPVPAEDDVIDVLMIGSSFCYYYVEELYGLAEAAGVKMRVCNVYYSGCKFDWHYTWWKQGKSNYEFYQVTDNTGRKKTSGVSLEYCLAQGNWDVISIQESTSTIYNAGAQNHLDATRAKRNELIGYLKDQFPEAKVYWHQPWSYQIGYKSGNTVVNTLEQQQERMMSIREFALGVCQENGVSRVNTGEAWQIYRKNYAGSNGLMDTLCARLGVGTNNVGDYYHDGDIGGGQYLNACVWFEIIMRDLRPEDNISCIGNTYNPVYSGKYTLSKELLTALQQSAHQAVLEYDFETPSTETVEGE